MVKVKSPCYSVTARGGLGEAIIFSSAKGVQYAKGNRLVKVGLLHFVKKKYTAQTVKQLASRDNFRNAIKAWNLLTEPEKQAYKDEAKEKYNTAVGVFIKVYLRDYYDQEAYLKYWLFGVGVGCSLFMFEKDFDVGSLMSIAVDN